MKLRWTPIATHDLESVWDFVASENEAAADQLVQRILSPIEQLQSHPRLGRTGRLPETRELVILGTPYIASYRTVLHEIQVLAILHGARRWPDNF